MRHVTYGEGGFDPSKPNNNIIEDVDQPDQPAPLDATGSLATLLTVVGVLKVQDAANAVGLTPDDLIREAEAWQAASTNPQEIV